MCITDLLCHNKHGTGTGQWADAKGGMMTERNQSRDNTLVGWLDRT